MQVAVKCNQLGVVYFSDALSVDAVLSQDLQMEPATFVELWRGVPEAAEQQAELPATIASVESATVALQQKGFLVLAHKTVGLEDVLYVAGQASMPDSPAQLLLELRFALGGPGVRAFYRGVRPDLAQQVFAALTASLAPGTGS